MIALLQYNNEYYQTHDKNHPFLSFPNENFNVKYNSDKEISIKSSKIKKEELENKSKEKVIGHFKNLLRKGYKKLTYLFKNKSTYNSFTEKLQKLSKLSKCY